MKKIQKGNQVNLNYKRKVEILRTVIYFAIVLAIFCSWLLADTYEAESSDSCCYPWMSSGIKGTCRCDRTLSISIN